MEYLLSVVGLVLIVEGVPTNISFLREVLEHARFVSGDIDTHFVEDAFFG